MACDVGGFNALKVEEVTVARVVMLPASGGLLTEVLARGFRCSSHLTCERSDGCCGLIVLVSKVAGDC